MYAQSLCRYLIVCTNIYNFFAPTDKMKAWIDDNFEMPDSTVALLIGFLEQNEGILSKRARGREFTYFVDSAACEIERMYKKIFLEEEKDSRDSSEPMTVDEYVEKIEEFKNLRKRRDEGMKITYRKDQTGSENSEDDQ
jgi:hypothetical protein